MPRHIEYYDPDPIDCNTQATALGQDFGVIADVGVRFERDKVVVIVTCRKAASAPNGPPEVQAMSTRPLKSRPNIAVMIFSALCDCWHQLDRGVLAAKPPTVSHGWNGRPVVARRAKR